MNYKYISYLKIWNVLPLMGFPDSLIIDLVVHMNIWDSNVKYSNKNRMILITSHPVKRPWETSFPTFIISLCAGCQLHLSFPPHTTHTHTHIHHTHTLAPTRFLASSHQKDAALSFYFNFPLNIYFPLSLLEGGIWEWKLVLSRAALKAAHIQERRLVSVPVLSCTFKQALNTRSIFFLFFCTKLVIFFKFLMIKASLLWAKYSYFSSFYFFLVVEVFPF